MCLLSHCWSDCLHLQRSGSISVSALLFLPCFECLVDSAAKPWCFISSHVTYSWFFFSSTPTLTPTLPPTHILKLWTMWNAWCLRFFETHHLCNAYSGLPFQAGNTGRATNQTALWICPSAHSRQKVHIYLRFTLQIISYSTFSIHIHIPCGSSHLVDHKMFQEQNFFFKRRHRILT